MREIRYLNNNSICSSDCIDCNDLGVRPRKRRGREGVFYGYASIFDICDAHNDIIQKGAFTNDIRYKSLNSIKFVWQHNLRDVIGIIQHMKEDDNGLFVNGKFYLDHLPKAIEIYRLIRHGILFGLSIGFKSRNAYYDYSKRARIITDLELFEISVVQIPANRYAKIYC